MRHIKRYKNLNIPKIGDYIIVKVDHEWLKDFESLCEFLESNIGKVIGYIPDYDDSIRAVKIKYYNIPEKLKKYFPSTETKTSQLKYIVAYGKTPEEVRIKVAANKYNI